MLTLVTFPIPTGTRSWVEDVVVDEAARGHGVGESLLKAAVDRSKALGAKTLDLTSRPSREAANRLYRRVVPGVVPRRACERRQPIRAQVGFEQRETNVYRISFT